MADKKTEGKIAAAAASALTDDALAMRLRLAADEPRGYSAAERAALMRVAADRIAEAKAEADHLAWVAQMTAEAVAADEAEEAEAAWPTPGLARKAERQVEAEEAARQLGFGSEAAAEAARLDWSEAEANERRLAERASAAAAHNEAEREAEAEITERIFMPVEGSGGLHLGEVLDALSDYLGETDHDPSDAPLSIDGLFDDMRAWLDGIAQIKAEERAEAEGVPCPCHGSGQSIRGESSSGGPDPYSVMHLGCGCHVMWFSAEDAACLDHPEGVTSGWLSH